MRQLDVLWPTRETEAKVTSGEHLGPKPAVTTVEVLHPLSDRKADFRKA